MILALLTTPARALSLSLVSESALEDGLTVRQYRTSSPSCDVWVAVIDLCADGVYVDASRASDTTRSAQTWGSSQGVQLATNGDFYKTGPLRVYGDAIGDGVRWPQIQTGLDPSYASEWYWQHYGWIAFGHDSVTFTHTGWVKDNAAQFGGATDGWEPSTVAPEPPPGTLALVSGFPELVVEGTVVTCSSPTDPSCFTDRSDMRSRNPRTAMGLTADHATFLLAVVDGRTSESAGMYGTELADLMGQLGAYEAFNLDGGGSTEMWTESDGYLNDPLGNDGTTIRSIANHWGVYAGEDPARPFRPGHCESAPVCGSIAAAGGEIDDADACFRTFGTRAYWREDDSTGEGGSLHWTNAWQTDAPDDWAWWRLELDEAGTYDTQVWIDPAYGVFGSAHYVVHAAGVDTDLRIDQGAASGWVSLGSFAYDAGGDQWVAVYDDSPDPVASDQHVTADALQLVRSGPWCGNGSCDGSETPDDCPVDCTTPASTGGTTPPTGDTTTPPGTTPTATSPDTTPSGTSVVKGDGAGCGCDAAPAAAGWFAMPLLGLMVRRRRS